MKRPRKRVQRAAKPKGTPKRALGQRVQVSRASQRGRRRPAATPRIPPKERERLIVHEAVSFFAERGFEGQTRELARRLGISQPLLYRYFPDKATLIERVFREVFLDRWSPQWQAWITDRSYPLPERLTRFYQDYARVILSYEWVRLFVFAALKGINTAKHDAELLFARIHPSVIAEIRAAQGARTLAEAPMTDAEQEHLWALHGAIFYLGVRRWVYRLPVPEDQDAAVAARVAAFLDAATGGVRRAAPAAEVTNQLMAAMLRGAMTQWQDPGTAASAADLVSR